MNELFVNIKVDREERPDLDQIYQTRASDARRSAAAAGRSRCSSRREQLPVLRRHLLPEDRALRHAGVSASCSCASRAVLPRAQATRSRAQNERSSTRSAAHAPGGAGDCDDAARARRSPTASRALKQSFDAEHGGFGGAPKFPHPAELELLPAHATRATGDDSTRCTMVSAHARAHGAGRHLRPARRRLLPLQRRRDLDDPALREDALRQRAAAARSTRTRGPPRGKPLFARVARRPRRGSCARCSRREGGYYSSLDADSEHEEGKFYVWTPRRGRGAARPPRSTRWPRRTTASTQPPNFEGKHWHLAIAQPLEAVAAALGASRTSARSCSTRRARKLLAAREQRVRPGRDEKVLVELERAHDRAAWRARARVRPRRLARLGARARSTSSAPTLWQDGRARSPRTRTAARTSTPISTTTRSCSTRCSSCCRRDFARDDLAFARELADVLLDAFEDRARRLLLHRHDHERLIHRPKPVTTTRCRRATASRRSRCSARPPDRRAALPRRGRAHASRRSIRRCSASRAASARSRSRSRNASRRRDVIVLRGPTPRLRPWRKELAPEYRPHERAGGDRRRGRRAARRPRQAGAAGPGQRLGLPRALPACRRCPRWPALRRLLGGAGIK